MSRMFCQQYRFGCFCHVFSCTNRDNSCLKDVAPGVHQSLPALVYRVVVGQIQVSDTVQVKTIEPFRFSTEDEELLDGRMNLGGWALKIAHNYLGRTKHGVDPLRKETADSMTINHSTYSAIKQNVTSENNCEGAVLIAQWDCPSVLRWLRTTGAVHISDKQANSQSYRKPLHLVLGLLSVVR